MSEQSKCLCQETCACFDLGRLGSLDWDDLLDAESRGFERCRSAILSLLEAMRLDEETLADLWREKP